MSRSSPRRIGLALAAAAALGGLVGACSPDRIVTGSVYPRDFRERHPIVLADAPRSLDVFVTGAHGLDGRQYQDVRTFADEFRRSGQHGIAVQVPTGTRNDAGVQHTFAAIRAALADGGVPSAYVAVSRYAPAEPAVASPIRLTFARLQAKVASKCGLWPQDLGSSDVRFSANNEPYWNLGCALQTNVAAQVADPVDLVRGRAEGRGDTIRRTKGIQDLRQGKDPSTDYRQDTKGRISSAFGN
jgi:pilus assembly protein CpaD